MIKAEIICDSISDFDKRLTTMKITFPRIILAEFNTHRQFSRNTSSSRAIPIKKMIKDVEENPFIPLHWGKHQAGMQAFEECNEDVDIFNFSWGQSFLEPRETAWLIARDNAVRIATSFMEAGYHKQIVNRLLEPFMWTHMVVSSTEWDNFFRLRDHKDAEPHIRMLAQAMKKAYNESSPKNLQYGEWHLPFIKEEERVNSIDDLLKVSTARCGRVSYQTFDGKDSLFADDVKLYDKLAHTGDDPEHGSPFEHQATPDNKTENADVWVTPGLHGNFVGWIQHRKKVFGSGNYK